MGNLIQSASDLDKVYKYQGVSSTLDSSISITKPWGVAWYEGDLIVSEQDNDKILVCSGFSDTVKDSFNAPDTNIKAIVVDNYNLYSLKANSRIYVHSGLTSTITDSFDPVNDNHHGLGADGSNLLQTEYSWDYKTVFKMSGYSSTISDSFEHDVGLVAGVTWCPDNDWLLVSSGFGFTVYKHSGFSDTILDDYSNLEGYRDMTLDNRNPEPECHLITSDKSGGKIYQHKELTSIIHDSISSPSSNVCGVAWYGDNLYSFDSDDFYKHSGFSDTITDSFQYITSLQELWMVFDADGNLYNTENDPDDGYVVKRDGFSETIIDEITTANNSVRGVTIDSDGNVIVSDDEEDRIYKHSGFSSTVIDSFSSPNENPTGITIDGDDNLISLDDYADKIYLHSGFSSTITDSFSSPSSNPMGAGYDCRLAEVVTFKPKTMMI
ncbi:MAG: hypothetical protein ACOC5T_08200 [Elusimicrobiota bacterium]